MGEVVVGRDGKQYVPVEARIVAAERHPEDQMDDGTYDIIIGAGITMLPSSLRYTSLLLLLLIISSQPRIIVVVRDGRDRLADRPLCVGR